MAQDWIDTVGLCAKCRHVRRVGSRRGSVFFLCERADSDSRYHRYPKLPVLRCPGFEPGSAEDGGAGTPESDD